MLDVAVIIVSWNVRDYLAGCLTSVYRDLAHANLSGRVWVVDNGSTDGTQALLHDLYPQVQLVENEGNVGFGAANNQGMKAALSAEEHIRYFLLLNPDTLIRQGAIAHLVNCLENCDQTGLAGARLVYGDGRFQHSAFTFPGLRQLAFDLLPVPARLYESRLNGRYSRALFGNGQRPFPVDFVLGAAMLVRRDVAEATGGFDESFHMYCEEIDLCWRIREAGWRIQAVPQAEIVHFSGESAKQVPAASIVNLWRSRALLYGKHHSGLRRYLARHIARFGLNRKAHQAPTTSLQHAYQHAAQAWHKSPR